jgi:hypothetical protein
MENLYNRRNLNNGKLRIFYGNMRHLIIGPSISVQSRHGGIVRLLPADAARLIRKEPFKSAFSFRETIC